MSNSPSLSATRPYRVRKGDSLWRIAEAQCGNPLLWETIARHNGLRDPNLIIVGQVLQIPEHATSGAKATRAPNSMEHTWNPPLALGMNREETYSVARRNVTAGRQPHPAGHVLQSLAVASLRPAEELAAPAFKHSLNPKHPVFWAKLGNVTVKFGVTGEITLQPLDTADLTITTDGVLEYTREQQLWSAGQVVKLLTSTNISWDFVKKEVQFSGGIAFSSNLLQGDLKFVSPRTIKYTCKPRDFEEVIDLKPVGILLKGNIALWVSWTWFDPHLQWELAPLGEWLTEASRNWTVELTPEMLITATAMTAAAALVVRGKTTLSFARGIASAGMAAMLMLIVITPEMKQHLGLQQPGGQIF